MPPHKIPDLASIERELVKREGLRTFVRLAWPLLHGPDKIFVDNWHIGAICEHVQALYDGDIQRLLINIPPRMSKTLTCSVFAPSWGWTKNAGLKYLFASYAGELSMDAAGKAKAVIMSQWFQERWGDLFALSETQNTKTNFETDKNGAYLATSVGGLTAGKGADIETADDLLKPKEAESLLLRTEASRFFWESLPTRFDNRATGRLCVVAQRLHPVDVPGEILEKMRLGSGRWETLILPLEYIPTTFVTVLGFKDPRTVEGESLDKVRYPQIEIDRVKEELGSYAYCTPGESPVLMADLSMKPIREVGVGDSIIGFSTNTDSRNEGAAYSRRRLLITKIKSISKSVQPVVKVLLSSGKTVRCTKEHNWYTGRNKTLKDKSRKSYMPARIGQNLSRVCEPFIPKIYLEEDLRDAGWLAGFFDGEGSAVLTRDKRTDRSTCLMISFVQGNGRNLILCKKLEAILKKFKFDFGCYVKKVGATIHNPEHTTNWYYLRGMTTSQIQRFLYIIRPLKWRDRFTKGALTAKFIEQKEKVISIKPDGEEVVYGLETETGNYVVWGLASSNSAMMQQKPVPREGGMIKESWFRNRFNPEGGLTPENLRKRPGLKMIVESADCASKPKQRNDPTVWLTWGVFGAVDPETKKEKLWVELWDVDRRRVAFPDALQRFKDRLVWWNQDEELIEDKDAGQGLIQQLSVDPDYKVHITKCEPKGLDKGTRMQAETSMIERGELHIPENAPWLQDYLSEMCTFTGNDGGGHDDMVDGSSEFLNWFRLKFRKRIVVGPGGESTEFSSHDIF